jgi:hypothetical protein
MQPQELETNLPDGLAALVVVLRRGGDHKSPDHRRLLAELEELDALLGSIDPKRLDLTKRRIEKHGTWMSGPRPDHCPVCGRSLW